MKIMASGPITPWEIDRETVETVSDFIFLGPKITADGDFSHEIKRCLLLGRKVMTNLDSILKSRDIILPTKVRLLKAMAFPVVMYGCESWTIREAEHQRIDAFEMWCWRRPLRVPWTARSNQSILKEISPGCSLEGLMLKPKLQYFGHLIWTADSFEMTMIWERLKVGCEGDDRGWDGWMASTTPRVYSNSCPSSRWCHPTISSSVVPFSSCRQSFPASKSFQMSQFFASGGQSIGVSASASVLLMNIQGWSPLRLTGLILQSKGLSRVFSNTTVQKHQFFSAQLSWWSNSHMQAWLLEKP